MFNLLNDGAIPLSVMLALDAVFLGMNYSFFESQIIQVQKVALSPKPMGIVACYLFLAFGLWYFILREKRTPLEALLLGIVIYGVYETTTVALLNKWNWKTVLVDTSWGGILFYLTTYITYAIVKML